MQTSPAWRLAESPEHSRTALQEPLGKLQETLLPLSHPVG